MSRDAARSGLVRRLMDLVFDGSARRLLAHMLENEKLNDLDRAEIRRMLDEDDARKRRHLDRGRKGAGHEWGRHGLRGWRSAGRCCTSSGSAA